MGTEYRIIIDEQKYKNPEIFIYEMSSLFDLTIRNDFESVSLKYLTPKNLCTLALRLLEIANYNDSEKRILNGFGVEVILNYPPK